MQASYNVIAYKDKPRLQTALELLRTTQEIEQQLEKVCQFWSFTTSSEISYNSPPLLASYTSRGGYEPSRVQTRISLSSVRMKNSSAQVHRAIIKSGSSLTRIYSLNP